jgi:hypothetical protein
MLDELAIARGDGRLARLLATWARISVLVIDDLLIRLLTPDQGADLLEVIEDWAGLRPVHGPEEYRGEGRRHARRRHSERGRGRAPGLRRR